MLIPTPDPKDFLTWPLLATFGGAVCAVALISQFLKAPLQAALPSVPVRLWVYVIALVVVIGADFANQPPPVTATSLLLDMLNGFGVALAAMGGYDQLRRAIVSDIRRGDDARRGKDDPPTSESSERGPS